MRKIFLVFSLALLWSSSIVVSQTKTSAWSQFKKISCPEKRWSFCHIFVAPKAWKITQYVRIQTDSIQKSNLLDGDADGGTVDAFRHALWMASLSQRMRWRKAYRLGKAHEKGNYIDYKKHRLEDGNLPDKVSSEMDLWNNDRGLEIGRSYRNISSDSLKKVVIAHILKGEMKVIRKNKQAQFVDRNGMILEKEVLRGKWETAKELVNSDYQK